MAENGFKEFWNKHGNSLMNGTYNALSIGSALFPAARALYAPVQFGRAISPYATSAALAGYGLLREGLENGVQNVLDNELVNHGLAGEDALKIIRAIR